MAANVPGSLGFRDACHAKLRDQDFWDYATANGTALAGSDYTETRGTLSFTVEEKLKLITIPLLNNSVRELSRSFTLNLSNASGDTLGRQTRARIVVYDNDAGTLNLALFDRAIKDQYFLGISGIGHEDLIAWGWFMKPNSLPSVREVNRTIQAHVLAFFNKYLKGQDDRLLDGRSPAYPRVIDFRKK